MPPISLCKSNPHYFELAGKPTVLVSSAEHYGSLLNLDFDYRTYFETLAADGLNQTRVFSGTYHEVPGEFRIVGNTLAPAPGRLLTPWEHAAGDSDGRYDLSRFSDAYFARLKDLLSQAARNGVVVELVLFCLFYNDGLWQVCPMNAARNVNGVGGGSRQSAYDLSDVRLQELQELLVRRIVREVNAFDNVYFELMNEPYFVPDRYEPWHQRMAAVIRSEEASLPNRHLIAWGVCNREGRVAQPLEGASILNFHYASHLAADQNYHLDLPMADDETGFRGHGEYAYRREAWAFMLSGGAVFSHLDYSFTVASPSGQAGIQAETPGWGSPAWRRQVGTLKRFVESFDLPRMRPMHELFQHDFNAPALVRVMGTGREFAVYVAGQLAQQMLLLPPGPYQVEYIRTLDGHVLRTDNIEDGWRFHPRFPTYPEDIAMRIRRKAP
jgi:hypothetical protein